MPLMGLLGRELSGLPEIRTHPTPNLFIAMGEAYVVFSDTHTHTCFVALVTLRKATISSINTRGSAAARPSNDAGAPTHRDRRRGSLSALPIPSIARAREGGAFGIRGLEASANGCGTLFTE